MNLVKEIRSKMGILHFRRWQLFSTKKFTVYLHEISEVDLDKHLHNHPWNYWNLVLWGSYIEQVKYSRDGNIRRPGNFIRRKAGEFHKIKTLLSKKVYTLMIVGPRIQEWGYDVNGKFIEEKLYRELKWQNRI